MSTLEDRIRLLEDREAIREVTASYCRYAVAGKAEEIAALFTRDGIMESGDIRVRGQAALLDLYRATFRDLLPVPYVHDHVIELAGDRATGYSGVEVRMVENGEAVTAAGYYDDVFEREDGIWKFAHRKLFFHHRVPLKQGWA